MCLVFIKELDNLWHGTRSSPFPIITIKSSGVSSFQSSYFGLPTICPWNCMHHGFHGENEQKSKEDYNRLYYFLYRHSSFDYFGLGNQRSRRFVCVHSFMFDCCMFWNS
ncbi:PREDICTED: uncharacterized protein LOC104752818 isoform X1 [Camelina sativa]|uniref:Uncharacterized protein LOC104752818 isoform X1 n=1 Tax=Camelina sativa TaxID=90675 RepID=A0ABM1R2B9_CAMSA|nr:PREDICTED: uncharacterized protein LOC104752818 isoform X1 [Camelina sativa]